MPTELTTDPPQPADPTAHCRAISLQRLGQHHIQIKSLLLGDSVFASSPNVIKLYFPGLYIKAAKYTAANICANRACAHTHDLLAKRFDFVAFLKSKTTEEQKASRLF